LKLQECSSEIDADNLTFGVGCTRKLLDYQTVIVEHSTDIARLKEQAPEETLVISNATLLTMVTGNLEQDLIQNGTVVVQDGAIVSAGTYGDLDIPALATVIDAQGGMLVMHNYQMFCSRSLYQVLSFLVSLTCTPTGMASVTPFPRSLGSFKRSSPMG
jgi:hypothetical protein